MSFLNKKMNITWGQFYLWNVLIGVLLALLSIVTKGWFR
jgi:hypothetical protein